MLLLLNNRIFTFYDLFPFTESIHKQTATVQLIIMNYYLCAGRVERSIVNDLLICKISYL